MLGGCDVAPVKGWLAGLGLEISDDLGGRCLEEVSHRRPGVYPGVAQSARLHGRLRQPIGQRTGIHLRDEIVEAVGNILVG